MGPIAAYANHDKDCKSTHGTVSAKGDNSVTVNGKTFNLDSSTSITKEDGGTASLASINAGDKVCIQTSSSDSKEASKVVVLNDESKGRPDEATGAASGSSTDKGNYADTLSAAQQKVHEEMCEGHHGRITDKTANSLTIDGKIYALKINTPVNKQEEPLLPKTVKVGDRVCYDLKKAADGSKQISRLIAIDRASDEKMRVREKESDSDDLKNGVDVKKDYSPAHKDSDLAVPQDKSNDTK